MRSAVVESVWFWIEERVEFRHDLDELQSIMHCGVLSTETVPLQVIFCDFAIRKRMRDVMNNEFNADTIA